MSGNLLNLLQRPNQPQSLRERRIEEWAQGLHDQIVCLGTDFDLEQAVEHTLIIDPDLEEEVLERAYVLALDRVWHDLTVTDDEKAALSWIGQVLDLAPERLCHLNTRYGIMVFERCLANAISDGVLEESEIQILNQVAAGIGTSVGQIMRTYFSKQGHRFLRALFLTLTDDGILDEREWERLRGATQALGMNHEEWLNTIKSEAQKFVEHVLADAKSDGILDAAEQKTLCWLTDHLKLSADFRRYVTQELDRLKTLSEIRSGQLPILSIPVATSYPDEVVHFQGPGQYEEVTHQAGGPVRRIHPGAITITNMQLLFESEDHKLNTPHCRVIQVSPLPHGLELRTMDYDSVVYDFLQSCDIAVSIYLAALMVTNPVVVEAREVPAGHRISRPLRQRVWQQYGGRCAECASTQYLEFNYIVPISRGGADAQTNLYLICRHCKMAQSDAASGR